MLNRMIKTTVVLLATATLTFSGCSGDGYQIAKVSGKVTANGQPVAGIRVIFNPQLAPDTAIAGPWSSGLTNEQGEFTLVTRYDKEGAMVTVHDVSFAWDDMDAEELEELHDELEEAQEEGEKEEYERIKKQIEKAKAQLKGRVFVSEDFSLEFEVSSGGTKDANFDVAEKENKSENE